jgi:tetratricopeptide (TPR) repeat protein/transglutaminase-like putative cysteine protease
MRTLAIAVLVAACAVAFAQQPPLPTAPSATAKTADKPANKAPDYSNEPYVVESQRTSYRFENDGTGQREITARVRVQSDAAVQQLGQLVIGYSANNEAVEIRYVRVRKADGSVVTAGESSVQDLSSPVAREAPVYTDYRQKHITVPGLRPGEVLEYDIVTRITSPLAPGEFWMEHDFARTGIVLDEELELNIPRNRAIKLKTRTGYEPKITDEGDRRIYRWQTARTQHEDDERKPKKKKAKDADQPAVQMTTFSSWEALGRWYAELERSRRVPDAAVRAKAAELTKDAHSEMDKVRALYDYVARNVRYVSLSFGLGRYQPHAAGDVLANQYGDCKDKHTLLAALLDSVGIHASSVLINSRRKLDPDIPSPSQFDHVITLVPVGRDNVWLDTTTEIAPFRLLTFNLRAKQALVIPASGTPRLMETPADAPVPNTQTMELAGKIDELGKLTGHLKLTFTGDSELSLRMAFRQVPNYKWKDLGKALAAMSGLRAEVSDVKADNPAGAPGVYHVEFDVAVPNVLDWSKRDSQMELPMASVRLPVLDDDEDATEPLELGPPGTMDFKLRLQLPPGYSARVPLPFSMSRDYADYKASYTLEGDTFVAERVMTLRWRELPPARLHDYRAFNRAVLADQQQALAVESAQQGTPKPPAGMSADDLYDAGIHALQASNFSAAIALLQRVTELEPKHKSAWNDLGRAYLALRQNDKAIAAFQKAIENNPYDEYAYNNMGRAYWDMRDYRKAADAFRKQIEVNPLDKYAHKNLGGMYLEEHRDKDAMPELEKAASLTPDDPLLQVSLGQAYLETNEPEKALAAFDRAVHLAPAPVVWNNIAYQLSLKGVHLERAEQYAESAVAATAAQLRNLDPSRMQVEQQALVASLAAYWDTLGWVHFQRGNLDKAEQFVRASWELAQHGEVGDHLGQIYEKRGEKEKAIRTYALALVAYKPEAETRARLAKLAGGDKKVEPLLEAARKELAAMSSISLGPLLKDASGKLTADFYVVLAPGPKVEDVRFIKGSDKLKTLVDALRAAPFTAVFPDQTPTRLLRRGTLSCDTQCVFTLTSTDDLTGGQ